MASSWGKGDESPFTSLRREIEEKHEELHAWRIRCLQAETEVRALKCRTRHADSALGGAAREPLPGWDEGPRFCISREEEPPIVRWPRAGLGDLACDGRAPKQVALRDAAVQKDDEGLCPSAAAPGEAPESEPNERGEPELLREELRALQAAAESREAARAEGREAEGRDLGEEVAELRQQLQKKNNTIVQLQADMVSEKKQIEGQRKKAERLSTCCREELREMTQRAESLSEQVGKAKRKASELQAAQHEVARLQGELEGFGAELRGSRREVAAAREEGQELRAELSGRGWELEAFRQRAATTDAEQVALEQVLCEYRLEAARATETHAAAKAECEEFEARLAAQQTGVEHESQAGEGDVAAQGGQQRVRQCVDALSQLHAELQRELRAPRGAPQLRRRSEALGGGNAGAAGGFPGERLLSRMAKQLERAQQLASEGPPGKAGHPAIPEGDEPPPDDVRRALPPWSLDASDTHQRLNEYRLAAEETREALTREHCEELDDLLRRHDAERRELHQEIIELRAELSRAQGDGAASRPLSEIRAHFESQVAVMKRELLTQLSDLHDSQSEQRGVNERELMHLRRTLDALQQDLTISQDEFATLSALYDKERRENMRLREYQRVVELRQEAAAKEELSQSEKAQQAVVATVASSHEMTPVTTESWDRDSLQVVAPAVFTTGSAKSVPRAHPEGRETPGAAGPFLSTSRPSSTGTARSSPTPPGLRAKMRSAAPGTARTPPAGSAGGPLGPGVSVGPGEGAHLRMARHAAQPAHTAAAYARFDRGVTTI